MEIDELHRLDGDDADYTHAEKNLESVKNNLHEALNEYKSSENFNSDEKRLEHVLNSGIKVTLAEAGSVFLKVDMSEDLRKYSSSSSGMEVLTSSEIPSDMEIHSMTFDTDSKIKVQLADA